MTDLLILKPVFKETIWGGNTLKEKFHFDTPSAHTGENWCISAHPHGDCEIINGKYQGKRLSYVYQNYPEIFGNLPYPEFPILVKWIDAIEPLSVQVHPDDAYARKVENSLGKSECWYVIDCKKDAKMVMGHHAQSKASLEKMIKTDDYDHLLNVIDIQPGDFYWIPSGTLHAICDGTLIYEVQQASDITYRVYDYHRQDAEGNYRELHLNKALDVIDVPSTNSKVYPKTYQEESLKRTVFLNNDLFKVSQLSLTGTCDFVNHEPMRLMTVLEGEGFCNGERIKQGMSFIITALTKEVHLDGQMILMETLLGFNSKIL